MSIPTNSAAPPTPSGSSNPVPLRSWFGAISDWIKGLSPSGSTAYDTGEVAWTSAATNFNLNTARSQRVGRRVHLSGILLSTAAVTIPGGAGIQIGTVSQPPAVQQLVLVTTQVGPVEAVINVLGVVTLRRLQGSVAFPSGNYVCMDGVTYRAAG